MAVIEVSKVSKSYGSKRALNGVSFKVEAGSIFGFLGPNGAGKTTTIRCLMDFIRPDSGQIRVLEKDSVKDSVELKRSIGYRPAGTNLYEHWTSKEHLDFVSRLRGIKPDYGLASRLELDLKTKAADLSTGNRQKLMIALAFAGTPMLLVLDEPTKGLDPLLQKELYDLLKDKRNAGVTVFMSSHNLNEVEHLCDAIAVIKNGRTIVEETLDTIRRKSIHHLNASFRQRIDLKRFNLAGVGIVSSNPHSLELKVTGDLTPVIKQISHYELVDLSVERASLEEVFLEMYK